jgi:hypothetical protein
MVLRLFNAGLSRHSKTMQMHGGREEDLEGADKSLLAS